MTERTLRVTIGGVQMSVPVFLDDRLTLDIVERVNQRLKAIEDQSPRIDTQAFALEAAFSFAVELERSCRERAQDTDDFLKALDRILARVDEIADEHLGA